MVRIISAQGGGVEVEVVTGSDQIQNLILLEGDSLEIESDMVNREDLTPGVN